jgi:hypothetical protein
MCSTEKFGYEGGLGEGIESVPTAWLEHDISPFLKDYLTSRHPRARGGEDLPDLEDGQVESGVSPAFYRFL